MSFTFIDHTADIALRFEAKDAPALLADACLALRRIYAGREVAPQVETHRTIAVATDNEAELLVRFLNEMIFLFDSEGLLVAGPPNDLSIRPAPAGLNASARVPFATLEASRITPAIELKAATYHGLRLGRLQDGRLQVTVVIDT